MGKSILLIVLGSCAIISTLILEINSNTTRGLNTTLSYYDNTQSRLIANSGIEIYLEKLRRDKTLSGNFPNNKLMGGTYSISISGPDSALIINSNGLYNKVYHDCKVNAKRKQVTLPPISSSIYISSTNLDLNLAGSIDINGNDHDMNGHLTGNPPLPGIGVNKTADSTYIVNALKHKISNAILGAGESPSVRSVPDITNWDEVTQNYIFASDITLPSGTYSTGLTLGTAADPKITYLNGDVHLTGNSSGYGIMIVNGNLEMSGNFTFKGIVIVYGKSQIATKTTGNSSIYGASIFVGESVDFQATGNALFFYSKQAIDNAKINLKSSRFEITSWWE